MMKRMVFCVALLVAAMFGMGAQAQDVAGQWQGTLHAGGKDLRIILKIAKDDGKLGATMYSIDQGAQGFKATGVTMDGVTLRLSIDVIGGKFEGKMSGDGKTISGDLDPGPEPVAAGVGEVDGGDGVGYSCASGSAEVDGGGCRPGVRCSDYQAESFGGHEPAAVDDGRA